MTRYYDVAFCVPGPVMVNYVVNGNTRSSAVRIALRKLRDEHGVDAAKRASVVDVLPVKGRLP